MRILADAWRAVADMAVTARFNLEARRLDALRGRILDEDCSLMDRFWALQAGNRAHIMQQWRAQKCLTGNRITADTHLRLIPRRPPRA